MAMHISFCLLLIRNPTLSSEFQVLFLGQGWELYHNPFNARHRQQKATSTLLCHHNSKQLCLHLPNSVNQLWCLADGVFEMHFQLIMFSGFLKLQSYSSLKAICIKTCIFYIQIHCSH